MSLFEKFPVDETEVAKLLKHHWDLELGKIIKASQNHTFIASKKESDQQFAVRVTPDPRGENVQRVRDEVEFVTYVAGKDVPHVCDPVPSISGELCVCANSLIIVVSNWAKGAALDFMAFRWMLDETIVTRWGIFFAKLHRASRQFSAERPETAGRIWLWSQMHNGVLSEVVLCEEDMAEVGNSEVFGIVHGDLNCSNLFFDDDSSQVSVFDWDQLQRGFFLWDLSTPIFTVVMLAEAGVPISRTPVPEADVSAFSELLVAAYEAESGQAVDRNRLRRMVDLRKEFYHRFCREAMRQGDVPEDMAAFIKYIADWFDSKTNTL